MTNKQKSKITHSKLSTHPYYCMVGWQRRKHN